MRIRGKPIFHGLVTALNQYNEIRIQFHVYTDGQDQMSAALSAFHTTLNTYGMAPIQLFFTDNPSQDKRFFTSNIPGLQAFQDLLDSQSAPTQIPTLPEPDYDSQMVTVRKSVADINTCVAAMTSHMDVEKIVGLDLEWVPSFGRGTRRSDRIAVMQICYVDTDAIMRVLVFQVYHLRSLPHVLKSFLLDKTVKFVGVNVTGDFHKIGRDCNLTNEINRSSIQHNVINLGKYARLRDVVQNGSIGLAKLSEIVLGLSIDKSSNLRLSDWNTTNLSGDQIKYAALDAIVSHMIYIELKKKPDLFQRLVQSDIEVGLRVDIVPQNGSLSCMATQAGTGTIVTVPDDICFSPDSISPVQIKCGLGHAIVRIHAV